MLTHGNPKAVRPTRVVILGAKGFLATHLSARLEKEGIPCRCVGSAELDLTQRESANALSEVFKPDDTVVMMSVLTPDKGRDYRTYMLNEQMAETVCRALERQTCGHFVYMSSDAVYDGHQTPLDEDSTREPVDLYSLIHTSREMLLGSVLAARNIPFCFLRPTSIYGQGDTHNNYGPNRFVRSAASEGKIILFGRGEERRSHLYVDDAITLILLSILHRSEGTLNLAAQPAVSYLDVANTVVRGFPTTVRIEFMPRTVKPVHRPYKWTQVFRFVYNLGRRIGPIVHRPYSIGAIKKAFPGYRQTPLEVGLRTLVNQTIEEQRRGREIL